MAICVGMRNYRGGNPPLIPVIWTVTAQLIIPESGWDKEDLGGCFGFFFPTLRYFKCAL